MVFGSCTPALEDSGRIVVWHSAEPQDVAGCKRQRPTLGHADHRLISTDDVAAIGRSIMHLVPLRRMQSCRVVVSVHSC